MSLLKAERKDAGWRMYFVKQRFITETFCSRLLIAVPVVSINNNNSYYHQ